MRRIMRNAKFDIFTKTKSDPPWTCGHVGPDWGYVPVLIFWNTAGNGIRVLYNVTRVPTALRITYHVDTRYMHAWYALETQCNGRIVTRFARRRGCKGVKGWRGEAAVAAAEVGCNGLEREGSTVSVARARGERSAGFQSTFYCL